jgi:hypothetical protein
MTNAIADSRGVRCDYWHVRVSPDPTKTWSLAGERVWDRDDKAAKQIAREMMRMVLDINTRQFGGRMVVTCNTCHRGATIPDRFTPLPPRDMSTIGEAASPRPRGDRRGVEGVRPCGRRAGGGFSDSAHGDRDRGERRHDTLEIAFKRAGRARLTSRMPPDPAANRYEDCRRVDGVMLPFVMGSSDGSVFDTAVRVFTSVRHDVEVDDSAFAMRAR